MKVREICCNSRVAMIIGPPKWDYMRKEFVYSHRLCWIQRPTRHRIPFFFTPQLHLLFERVLEDAFEFVFEGVWFKSLWLPYHILHGIICGYNMREILKFWKKTRSD